MRSINCVKSVLFLPSFFRLVIFYFFQISLFVGDFEFFLLLTVLHLSRIRSFRFCITYQFCFALFSISFSATILYSILYLSLSVYFVWFFLTRSFLKYFKNKNNNRDNQIKCNNLYNINIILVYFQSYHSATTQCIITMYTIRLLFPISVFCVSFQWISNRKIDFFFFVVKAKNLQ